MGQQHRKIVKRRRRAAYLDRQKAKAKKVVAPRREPAAKPKAKKQAATARPAEAGSKS
jgi:hypothetical protein